MSTYMKSLVLLLAIVLVFEGGKTRTIAHTRATVRIINEVTGNQDLTLHCKSKDDDLGEHTLKSTQFYEFSFMPRAIGVTLFFCNFRWPSNNSDHYFDIYDEDRDWCDACYWDIAESGPCLQNDGLGRRLCYSWNPKP